MVDGDVAELAGKISFQHLIRIISIPENTDTFMHHFSRNSNSIFPQFSSFSPELRRDPNGARASSRSIRSSSNCWPRSWSSTCRRAKYGGRTGDVVQHLFGSAPAAEHRNNQHFRGRKAECGLSPSLNTAPPCKEHGISQHSPPLTRLRSRL